jgi:hypothetical protein
MWYAADDTADYADYASSPGEGERCGGFMGQACRLTGSPVVGASGSGGLPEVGMCLEGWNGLDKPDQEVTMDDAE